jgi:predicted lipoprotein with Yx(FWY)xxD motif
MHMRQIGLAGIAAAGLLVAACSSSSSTTGTTGAGSTPAGSSSSASGSTAASSSSALKTAMIGGADVLTNAKGFTLYWFVPDTSTKSNCNGTCAKYWPPVKGPVTASSGVTGKLGTITRDDGSTQATFDGHPLYTYVSDTAPGMASGNNLNISGGVWHEVTVSGAPAPASSSSASKGGNGY